MEIKYEAVFGDQSLFDSTVGTINDDALIILARGDYKVFFQNIEDAFSWMQTDESYRSKCICSYAMRRIIRTPTWTVADQKAGKLPDIGSKAVSVYGFCVVDILAVRNGCVVACNSDISDARPCVFTIDNFLELFTPIESPEEKAARLRKEWCIKALSSCSILSGMQKYELKRLGGYIEDIHDALLSGNLPVPVKEQP